MGATEVTKGSPTTFPSLTSKEEYKGESTGHFKRIAPRNLRTVMVDFATFYLSLRLCPRGWIWSTRIVIMAPSSEPMLIADIFRLIQELHNVTIDRNSVKSAWLLSLTALSPAYTFSKMSWWACEESTYSDHETVMFEIREHRKTQNYRPKIER